ncbi:MAG: hypothetical protein J5I50_13285 [Chitinophagaceae bacterium]|nr:hypothetical protein [Chitinophagaceae bacterium]
MWRYFLKRKFIILILFVPVTTIVHSQISNYPPAHKIDVGNGLSDNNIRCIYKDNNDIMWIGTSWGLNRIDGSTITVFSNNPENPNSISDNVINCIAGDYDGLLWAGTEHGLNFYEPATGKWGLMHLRSDGETEDMVTSIAIDKKNTLYLGTNSGLYIYYKKKNKTIFIKIPGNTFEKRLNNHITNLLLDKQGILWMGTFNGIWTFNPSDQKFIHQVSSKNDPAFSPLVTSFIIDHSGKIWYGTWDEGIKTFDPQTKKVTTFSSKNNYDRQIRSILEVKQNDGTYHICFNNYFQYYDTRLNRIISQQKDSSLQWTGSVLYSKDDRIVWTGTNHGLFFYNTNGDLIKNHRYRKPTTSQSISILEWKTKILVSGSNSDFLKLFDKNLDAAGDYSKSFDARDASCLKLSFAGNDIIRCGTNEGIADINLNTHSIRIHQLSDSAKSNSNLSFITTLLKDSKHNWWYFPWRGGVWESDSGSGITRQVFRNFIKQYSLPKLLVISDVCEDNNGNLWMGDLDEGVILYDRKKNKFSKPFASILGQKNRVSQIVYFKHFCYAFTSTTLWMWNTDSMQLHGIRFSPRTDKIINSIAIDSSGNIWMATQNGLNVYNLKNKSYRHFTTADGLLRNEMNGTLYCCSDGTMIYACPEYLSSFQPEELLYKINTTPKIRLIETIVNGNPYKFNLDKRQYFDHNTNNFIFRWAVTDYNDPLNNRYYYKLEGKDKDWRFAGKTAQAEFASLSPGDYTLLLKGVNSNGIAAGKILKLQFTIMQPFWETWWFLTLIFISIAGFFYFLYRYRLSQIMRIQQLRNKISLNLHDDIGSTLSSISILSDMAIRRKKEPESEKMLKEIRENSMQMMDRMDDIVWGINPGNDSLEKLLLRIKTFAAKLFEAKEINYKIKISDKIQHIHMKMEYRQHLYLIIKEAINNIVKYASCTEAEIDVSYHDALLHVEIKDNGKGFDSEINSSGNGLVNMKKRASEIGARLQIISKKGNGTKILLTSKIK